MSGYDQLAVAAGDPVHDVDQTLADHRGHGSARAKTTDPITPKYVLSGRLSGLGAPQQQPVTMPIDSFTAHLEADVLVDHGGDAFGS